MRFLAFALAFSFWPIPAHAQSAPLPPGVRESGATASGAYAHGTSAINWNGEVGAFVRERRELCRGRGLAYSPPSMEAWLYSVDDERIALTEYRTFSVVDQEGCVRQSGARRIVERRVRLGNRWSSEASTQGEWQTDSDWPGPFRGTRIRCSRFNECSTNRYLGVRVRCSSAGNGFFIDARCAVMSGPLRGVTTSEFSWADDSNDEYAFTVNELRIRTPIDTAVFLSSGLWCTHRTALSSPCEPGRPGELIDIFLGEGD